MKAFESDRSIVSAEPRPCWNAAHKNVRCAPRVMTGYQAVGKAPTSARVRAARGISLLSCAQRAM